jgi:hypothetical protein
VEQPFKKGDASVATYITQNHIFNSCSGAEGGVMDATMPKPFIQPVYKIVSSKLWGGLSFNGCALTLSST